VEELAKEAYGVDFSDMNIHKHGEGGEVLGNAEMIRKAARVTSAMYVGVADGKPEEDDEGTEDPSVDLLAPPEKVEVSSDNDYGGMTHIDAATNDQEFVGELDFKKMDKVLHETLGLVTGDLSYVTMSLFVHMGVSIVDGTPVLRKVCQPSSWNHRSIGDVRG